MKTHLPASLLYALLLQFSATAFAAKDNTRQPLALPDSNKLIVTTAYGKVKGAFEKNAYTWKGIRYAAAPVGDLRFKAPQAPQPWQGVFNATAYGPASPQSENGFIDKNVVRDEDCLSLNIWSPAPDSAKRPVMFWIHGGGFSVGTGASAMYNGANLANNGDVVVVTINYRLGVLGFLYFDEAAQKAGFENNLGIRDQIAALQWVKQNIAAFGGDPNNITIFGESAGGTSVETLLACPAAKGLFHKAIAESGPAAILWQPSVAGAFTDKYLNYLGLSKNNLQQLKELPVDILKQYEDSLQLYMIRETPNKVFSPTIDGSFLATDIFTCLRPQQSGNVALMIGTNKDESTIFARKSLSMVPRKAEVLDKQFLHVLNEQDKKRITATYPKYPRTRGVLDLVTDAIFRVPAMRMAECQSMHSPVYMYRFEYTSFLLNLAGLRSFHGLEIPFVFGNTDGRVGKILRLVASKKNTRHLTENMQQAWVNFARFGNPNGKEGKQWEPFDAERRATMIFNRKSALSYDPDSENRKAWEGVKYY